MLKYLNALKTDLQFEVRTSGPKSYKEAFKLIWTLNKHKLTQERVTRCGVGVKADRLKKDLGL